MKKFENYKSNLAVLSKAYNEDLENEFIISGIINKFFVQFELAWKVLEELLHYEGKSVANTSSPREIIKAAYAVYECIDESVWLDMLQKRNSMTYIYDGNEAVTLVETILNQYIPAFGKLSDEIDDRYQDMLEAF